MSSQQLDLFDDYAMDLQQEQTDSLKGFFEATGIRNSSSIVYGEDNPFCQKELFVPTIPGKNTAVFYQIIGNIGGYDNKEYLDDTDMVLLPDETLRKLEQGTKDEVALFLEKQYAKSSTKFLKLRFTTESDFLGWVKRRLEKSPDEGTLRLLDIYERS